MRNQKRMVELAKEYLVFRRKLGFKLRIEGYLLLKFTEYADESGHQGPITTELALRWARLPQGASPIYQARRLEIVRCFAKHRAIFDQDTEIPPDRLLGPAHRRIPPHIYSHREIRDLIEAAWKLSPIGGLRPRTYAVLFGLLDCTGIRISEALRLCRNDADLEQGLLTIRETKYYKSRLVPIHPSTTERLRTYCTFRDQYHPLPRSDAFFLSERGTALKYSTVRNTFRKISDQLGWKAAGGTRRPRIYDLRHTFACRRLLQWYRDGIDIDHAIGALSTYMGHGKVTDTYWYLTGVPELFQIAVQRFERFAHSHGKETL
jgi:integrase